jgi:hypothetical protein
MRENKQLRCQLVGQQVRVSCTRLELVAQLRGRQTPLSQLVGWLVGLWQDQRPTSTTCWALVLPESNMLANKLTQWSLSANKVSNKFESNCSYSWVWPIVYCMVTQLPADFPSFYSNIFFTLYILFKSIATYDTWTSSYCTLLHGYKSHRLELDKNENKWKKLNYIIL